MFSHTHKFFTDDADCLQILEKQIQWQSFGPSPKSRRVAIWNGSENTLAESIISNMVYELQSRLRVVVRGVFLNLYKDGNDYCPYHKDQYGTDVYTISLGETRDLLIKSDAKGSRAMKITLESGDLYYMPKELHVDHKHSVPKRKNATGTRISVVFFTN